MLAHIKYRTLKATAERESIHERSHGVKTTKYQHKNPLLFVNPSSSVSHIFFNFTSHFALYMREMSKTPALPKFEAIETLQEHLMI